MDDSNEKAHITNVREKPMSVGVGESGVVAGTQFIIRRSKFSGAGIVIATAAAVLPDRFRHHVVFLSADLPYLQGLSRDQLFAVHACFRPASHAAKARALRDPASSAEEGALLLNSSVGSPAGRVPGITAWDTPVTAVGAACCCGTPPT